MIVFVDDVYVGEHIDQVEGPGDWRDGLGHLQTAELNVCGIDGNFCTEEVTVTLIARPRLFTKTALRLGFFGELALLAALKLLPFRWLYRADVVDVGRGE